MNKVRNAKIIIEEVLSNLHDGILKGDLIMTTSFGYSGIVLIHIMKDYNINIPIYFFNTEFHFKETIDLSDKVKKEWDLNVIQIKPNKDVEVDYTNPSHCCYERKTKPLLEIIEDDTIWISAIRREQSESRRNIKSIFKDSRGTTKVCPLYNWTNEDCWKYIEDNNLPYNPLHDKGYMSIGCKPCTTPISDNENERSGRWRGTDKEECGLHTGGE